MQREGCPAWAPPRVPVLLQPTPSSQGGRDWCHHLTLVPSSGESLSPDSLTCESEASGATQGSHMARGQCQCSQNPLGLPVGSATLEVCLEDACHPQTSTTSLPPISMPPVVDVCCVLGFLSRPNAFPPRESAVIRASSLALRFRPLPLVQGTTATPTPQLCVLLHGWE